MAVNGSNGDMIYKLRENALIRPDGTPLVRDGLRFWPVIEPGDGEDAEAVAGLLTSEVTAASDLKDPVIRLIVEGHNAVFDALAQTAAQLKAGLAGLETENARLRAQLAEARSKIAELDFVVERLKVENKGPPGVKGERGRDGHDGGPGPRGERGQRGAAGRPAPVITAWEVRPEAFEIVPVFSTGERGPAISLLALFQAYDSATALLEDRDLTEAAQEARALAEREAEASRWAR